jgi:hypothetical protein
MYGLADCNTREAHRLYQKRFPGHRILERKVFGKIPLHARECGAFVLNRIGQRRPQSVSIPESGRKDVMPHGKGPWTAVTERFSQNTVMQILHEQLPDPYHLQRVQGLTCADYPGRATFRRWFLQKCAPIQIF